MLNMLKNYISFKHNKPSKKISGKDSDNTKLQAGYDLSSGYEVAKTEIIK